MSRKISLVCLFLLLIAENYRAQSMLGYKEFMEKVEKNHPLSKKYENIATAGVLGYKAARGNYDPFLTTSYENKFYNSQNYYSILHSEIKQPLFTSQYLKLGYDYGQGDYINPQELSKYGGIPYIGMEAALLQGMMIDKRRAGVLKAKHYAVYSDADRKVMLNELYFGAALNYIDWSLASKEMNLYTYFAELARVRFEGIKTLSEIAEKAPIDSVEAGLLYNSRLMEMQLVSMDYTKSEAVALTMYRQEDLQSSIPAFSYIPDSLERFFELAKSAVLQLSGDTGTQNPVLRKYEAYGNVLKVEQRLKAEMIKPKVDLKYNFLLADKYNEFATVNTNSYKWGAAVSFPLFMRTARNENKLAKLDVKNNLFEWNNKSYELNLKQEAVRQNISILLNQILLAEKNVRYSRQMVEAEKLKFDNGESTLFLINTRESKWLETELKLASIRAKFIKMTLEYIYLKGNLDYLW